jgi:hypothetical protein
MSAGSPVSYEVEQSFTGDSIYYQDHGSGPVQKDSTHIENQIRALRFEVLNDGKVAFSGNGQITLDRFIQSSKDDTCFTSSPYKQACLRKNIGITGLFFILMHGNHQRSCGYSLIEGPTY